MPPSLLSGPPKPVRVVRPLRFGPVFWIVAVAHGLLILLLILWTLFRPHQEEPVTTSAGAPMELIALPGPPTPAQAAPAPAPPAPPPPPQPETPPEPQPPTPPAPEPPEPAPTPPPTVPEPPPAPSDIVLPPKPPAKPAPAPTPAPKAAAPKPAPAKPAPAKAAAPHQPKINLTEVTRISSTSTSAASSGMPGTPTVRHGAAAARTGGSAVTSGSVASRLGAALAASGASAPIEVGSGSGGPPGDPTYYDLIRQQMYANWEQPMQLAGRSLRAKIEIKVEKDGTVTQAALLATSGNPTFDQSALAAARRVGKLPRPRPDSVPERVVINFQLVE